VKRSRRTPPVLERLFAEHRYLTALAHTLATHSGLRSRVRIGELYLLRDVVAYLHDYPDHVHHPTEELLFERLMRRKPALQETVARLRRDHEFLAKETERLLAQLDELIARPGAARAREALAACRALAERQRAHLKLENHEAFPAAIAALSRGDWKRIEARFLSAEDPLFGKAVSRRHRRLYEYLLDFTDGRDRAMRLHSLLADLRNRHTLLTAGAAEGCTRLAKLGESIASESLSAMSLAVRPASLQAAAALPARYWWQIGRSVAACGADLLRICMATAQRTLSLHGIPQESTMHARAR
jgi:hemerythrin-like domain-containing protein